MNKQELGIVVVLFIGLLGWGYLNRDKWGAPPPPPVVEETEVETALPEVVAQPEDSRIGQPADAVVPVAPQEDAVPVPDSAPVGQQEEEQVAVLSNEEVAIKISSWGGGISAVQLTGYREENEEDSGPIVLEFGDKPALELTDIAGLPAHADFQLTAEGRTALLTRKISDGITLERRLELGDGYSLVVTDTFKNDGAVPATLPIYGMRLGPMEMITTKAKTRGISYLGIDSLSDVGGERVAHWLKTGLIRKSPVLQQFKAQKDPAGIFPDEVTFQTQVPMVWAATKNKFFTQILVPEQASRDCLLHAQRDTAAGNRLTVNKLWAELTFGEKLVDAGSSVTRSYDYYVGPKKYSILRARPDRQADIMEFGRYFGPISRFLLLALNAIYGVVRNYGVAIIILTAIVRILFWPITHKSTESMKKMQKIQPLVQKIRDKYKDKPQKMNAEVMALYKEHKVNPMAGCLPIVVQIPVFIALFTVLRSAIELRFAGFLWISDLSEPEGLLVGVLPFALNILPVFMTVTMIIQQRLTPSAGDPQQQKMFMMMPVVMLFIFYNMASALVLYWSVSQSLSIVQLLLQRRKGAREEALAAQQATPVQAEVSPAPEKSKRRKRK